MADEIRIELDMRVLEQLERQTPGRADQIVRKIAFDLVADLQTHFSNESPSRAGDPPGVDTGMLKSSISFQSIGNAEYEVTDGVEYGAYLEYGTVNMAARPWFLPGIDRISKTVAQAFKGLIDG